MISLGIDTSNYTTSTSLFDSESREVKQQKRLLPVKEGEIGIRQSDAVFHHTAALPELLGALFKNQDTVPDVLGCSVSPREAEGSYMPCFTVGSGAARNMSAVFGVPLCRFSHQQGHVAAAVFSGGKWELFEKQFIAFHVSGGTTEAVMVSPDKDKIITCNYLCGSLDLKAGQAVDRVGRMLGLRFPAGAQLEKLAAKWEGKISTRPVLKENNCSLSGLENQCAKLKNDGQPPEFIARFCLESIAAAIENMTKGLLLVYGKLPVVYAGGVMSDMIIQNILADKFDCCFATPEFSCDNAAGIAILAALAHGGNLCE